VRTGSTLVLVIWLPATPCNRDREREISVGFDWGAAIGCDDAWPDFHQFGRLLDWWLTYVDGLDAGELETVPSLLGESTPDGDGGFDQRLSPEYAGRLADWLEIHADALTAVATDKGWTAADVAEAAAWLRWAARFGPISASY
jgi:hypothetical protein